MDNIIKVQSAIISKIKGYNAYIKDNKTYIGKKDNYDNKGNYNNHDNSFRRVSDNETLFHLLSSEYSMEVIALQFISKSITVKDFEAYAELIKEFNIPLYKDLNTSDKDNKFMIDLHFKEA